MNKMMKLLSRHKRALVTGSAGVLTAAAGPSFADGIDTTAAMGYIAAGVVAAALVGGAMFGLVALIGAGKKAQRAGT